MVSKPETESKKTFSFFLKRTAESAKHWPQNTSSNTFRIFFHKQFFVETNQIIFPTIICTKKIVQQIAFGFRKEIMASNQNGNQF